MILTLAENEILCLDDLAELDSEELVDFSLSMALMMKQSLVYYPWLLEHILQMSRLKMMRSLKQQQLKLRIAER